jgi:type II secretory pathway component PulF
LSAAYREFLTGLRTQLRAGIPLKESLANLEARGRGRRSRLAREVLEALERGETLAGALRGARAVRLPPVHLALIDAGERSGTLSEMLGRVLDDLELLRQTRATVATRALYPVAVLIAAAVLPPLYLLVTGRAGEYLRLQLRIFAPLATLFVLWRLRDRIVPHGSAVRNALERVVRAVPLLGRFLIEYALSRALSLLGVLLEAGFGFADSLPLVGRASGWRFLEQAFARADAKIRDGATAAEALEVVTAIPSALRSRIATGEVSGTLDRALQDCGRELWEATATRLDRFVRLLPVVLILLAGAVVVLLALNTFSGVLQR